MTVATRSLYTDGSIVFTAVLRTSIANYSSLVPANLIGIIKIQTLRCEKSDCLRAPLIN